MTTFSSLGHAEIVDFVMDANEEEYRLREQLAHEEMIERQAEEESFWASHAEGVRLEMALQDEIMFPYMYEGIETLCTGCPLFEGKMELMVDYAADL